ncbi:MAG: hydrogenase maturation peptidase HycI [bacterium]
MMTDTWLSFVIKACKNAEKICIMGVGNKKRGDDAIGPLTTMMIMTRLKWHNENLIFIDSGEVPENFTGEIRKFQPTLTIIIDACISGNKPGTIYIVDPEKIQENDFSTHRMPLSMLIQFLETTIPTKVIILAIEPKNLNFIDDISPEVKRAIDKLVASMVKVLNEWQKLQIFYPI